MSDFHSLAERLGFSFCWYLFKRKHVCCLITAWHLTVFSDQSDKFFHFLCWPSGGAATRKKHTALSLSSSLSKAGFRHSYQHQIPRVLCWFFSFICVYFSLFFTLTQSAETSSLRSQLNSRKITFQCQKCQPPNLLADLPQCEPSPSPPLCSFTEPAQPAALKRSVLFSVGHCRHCLLYTFRMCSTVNYQLYVILVEKWGAGGKQQSHQSL